MDTQLYIPKRIKVGFQKRSDTFTGMLAYIIYYDDKGKLRKETSWQGWRDKTIDVLDLDNSPQSGLVLNKDIKRYNWGHFSSNRTMIRVHDPRNFEFEITTENLIGVLMNTDCSKRGLVGEFVYAWHGPELVLLPTNCEEYEKAVNYTELQGKKIGVKGLIPGCSYKTKKEKDVIYLGRFNWYAFESNYRKSNDQLERKVKKSHIFVVKSYDETRDIFEPKSNLDFLSICNSEEPVSNYAALIEQFQCNIHSSSITKVEYEKIKSFKIKEDIYYGFVLSPSVLHTVSGNIISENYVLGQQDRVYEKLNDDPHSGYNYSKWKEIFRGFYFTTTNRCQFDVSTLKFLPDTSAKYYHYYNNSTPLFTKEDLEKKDYYDVYVTLENGRKIKLDSMSQLLNY